MATARITKRAIEGLIASAEQLGKPQFLWDAEIKGFGIKASPKGACSYVVQKSIGGREGKDQRVTIGHYPTKHIDEARDEARKAVSNVHDGGDIAEARRQVKQAQKDRLSTELLATFEVYLTKRATPGRYWPEVESLFKNAIIPELGERTPVQAISKRDIRSLIDAKEAKHPDAARNWFSHLRPFFKWCVERDLIPFSPMDTLTPPALAGARDRILTEDELKVFWKATEAIGYPFGPFYQLLLLTAQRREEVAAMTWPEMKLGKTEGEWIIPKERTKNGKEHLVHLSPSVVSILYGLPTISKFVFTTNGTAPISGYSKAKAKLDKLIAAECASVAAGQSPDFRQQIFQSEWRVHDLRRTAASGMAELGFQPHIVERVLNHISGAQGGLVGVYQRFEYADERQKAVEAWSNKLSSLLTHSSRENVVPLRK